METGLLLCPLHFAAGVLLVIQCNKERCRQISPYYKTEHLLPLTDSKEGGKKQQPRNADPAGVPAAGSIRGGRRGGSSSGHLLPEKGGSLHLHSVDRSPPSTHYPPLQCRLLYLTGTQGPAAAMH